MVKVVHLITSLNVGGAEVMLLKLLKNMKSKDIQNVVISMLDKGQLGKEIEKLNIKVYTLNMKRGLPNLKSLLSLRKILDSEKPDVLQTWLYHADLLGLFVGKICRIKKILWNIRCTNMDLKQYSIITKVVLRLLVLFSTAPNAIVVNSTAGKQFHQKLGYTAKEWVLIFNGFETEKFTPKHDDLKHEVREKLGIGATDVVIGTVARFDPMKGHFLLIEAAAYLVSVLDYNMPIFILVGKGVDNNNRELLDALDKHKLQDKFLLLGERNDVSDILASIDIYVSPSLGEGFPNVVGEAMSSGVPCIVTDVGDSARVVCDHGIIVPSADAVLLAKAIKQMIDMDEKERVLLGMKARGHIIENYDIINIAGQYEQLYLRI